MVAKLECEPLIRRVRALALGPGPRRIVVAIGAVSALVLLLLWMEGAFGPAKVRPGTVPLETGARPPSTAAVVREVDEYLEWPGTVRSRKVAQVGGKILARVLDVRVAPGAVVRAGDVLAVLDDREVKARVEQARAALVAAEAEAAHAESDRGRFKSLFDEGTVSARDLEAAETRAKSAAALEAQARDALAEAKVLLGEAVVRAPFDGVVVEKLAEPGDMAVPGRAIVAVHDPERLRLESQVPESCAAKASLGMDVRVRVDGDARELIGRIEEIAPAADPQSRTYLVKAALPADAGVKPGAFARFVQPCGRRRVLLVPAASVERSGQIEMVRVVAGTDVRVRHVRTGKAYGADVEIVSGLAEGERVVTR